MWLDLFVYVCSGVRIVDWCVWVEGRQRNHAVTLQQGG